MCYHLNQPLTPRTNSYTYNRSTKHYITFLSYAQSAFFPEDGDFVHRNRSKNLKIQNHLVGYNKSLLYKYHSMIPAVLYRNSPASIFIATVVPTFGDASEWLGPCRSPRCTSPNCPFPMHCENVSSSFGIICHNNSGI